MRHPVLDLSMARAVDYISRAMIEWMMAVVSGEERWDRLSDITEDFIAYLQK